MTLEIDESTVDGEPVIVAVVQELDPSQKPCRVATEPAEASGSEPGTVTTGRLSLRYKGFSPPEDNLASTLLRSLARRGPILTRRSSTTLSVRVAEDRNSSPKSATARSSSGGWGVTVGEDRIPSVAGLLALGIYPQQHLPGTGLQAVLAPGPERSQTRALDSRRFDGPIPRMLADALAWVSRSSPTEIRAAPNGVVRDVLAWPTAAVRELIGNALIHRDLAPWALGETPPLR